MARAATGQLIRNAMGFSVRVRVGPGAGDRPAILLDARREGEARARAALLADLALRLRPHASPDEVRQLLTLGGQARTERELAVVLEACEAIAKGQTVRASAVAVPTFAAFAEEWTSGRLRKAHPDHVRRKDPEDDIQVLADYINPVVGPKRITDVTLEHAERVMAGLPSRLAPRTRKRIAQCMSKVLSLAVYPGRHIAANPIPREWMPKIDKSANKAKACLYPEEDAKLLSCEAVPLDRRIAYGILAREGMRASELGDLRWRAVDLERGRVRLDVNKTADPRAWALSPDVVRVLAWWKKRNEAGEGDLVLAGLYLGDGAWHLRGDADWTPGDKTKRLGDLRTAGITRPELFERTAVRLPIRLHDLRATFVTVSLANGKTEQWVTDRTGHRSSQMLATYTRQARTWSELALGTLQPLDALLPELSNERPALPKPVAPLGEPLTPSEPPRTPPEGQSFGHRMGTEESHLGDLNPRPAVYETAALPLS